MRIDPYVDQRPEFRAWFQDSKLINQHGGPLVIYHGTNLQFTAFCQGEEGIHLGTRKAALDRARALRSKQILMPLYARLRNPLRVPDLGMWGFWTVMRAVREVNAISEGQAEQAGSAFVGHSDARGWQMLHEALEGAGYDGFIYRNEVEGRSRERCRDSWVVFRPEQIKSAVGNSGHFDQADPDIYH